MAVEPGFLQTLLAAGAGFALFVSCDLLLKPVPSFRRPLAAWAASFGIWAVLYSVLLLIIGRVLCACAAGLAMYLVIVLVNNAKQKSMREPFLFQDYDYFLDTLRFPRLFLPFMGLKSFCIAAFFCILAIGAIALEKPFEDRWLLNGQLGAILVLLVPGCLFLYAAYVRQPSLSLRPQKDLQRLGLTAFLFFYGLRNIAMPGAISPFGAAKSGKNSRLPDLVAFQSESFFDPRPLVRNINPEILGKFDALRADSFLQGNLHVPAWGANTARTEFAFLTGICSSDLDMHQFNPYQTMLRGWRPASLPKFLQSIGYHTICVHPYYSAFYGRKKIFPDFGFDEFIDIGSFASRAGSYIPDMELAEKLTATLAAHASPVFIFAISMENHGPLHLEKQPEDAFTQKFLPGLDTGLCPELPIYLKHLSHTDELAAYLQNQWRDRRPVSMCFYGDHVPIMPHCYASFGIPAGEVPYFCWANFSVSGKNTMDLHACDLAQNWLQDLGIAFFGN